jgi:hypothetical protein
MFTTCFTRTYKNMYNPKSKISLLLLSSIATMLAGIQDENKRKQGDKRIEAKRILQLNVLGEPIFSVMVAGWFCGKSG